MTVVYIIVGVLVLGQIIYSTTHNEQQSWNCKLFVLFGGVDHNDIESLTPVVEGLRETIPPAYSLLAYHVYVDSRGDRAQYLKIMSFFYQRGRRWAREKGLDTKDNQHWSNVYHSAYPG